MAGQFVSLLSIVLSVGLFVAGCQPAATTVASGGPILISPDDTISVFQLAERLGLEARCKTRLSTILTDAANTVIVYSDPGGRAFVNGKQVGPTGGVVSIDGVLFLSPRYEASIRGALRPLTVTAKPPKFEVLPGTTKGEQAVSQAGFRLVIDAGHGGHDPGALGVRGVREKTVNLAVAGEVTRLLEAKGHDAQMTRAGDTFVELPDRAAFANRVDPALFVSIHSDSNPRSSARGYTVYVARKASGASVRAAEAIERAMASTGLPSLGVRRADYRVLVGSACPAVLVELGFLSNPTEASLLSSEAFQKQLAQALASGICKTVGGQ